MSRRAVPLLPGVVAVVAAIVGGIAEPAAFLHSYLWAYLFWLGLALGSLGIIMMHHLSGGSWGFVVRRICEAAAMTLPLLAILFLPILIGMRTLFPWADPAAVAADHAMRHRSPAFTPVWFVTRACLYFVVWIGLAVLMRRWSLRQDENSGGDPAVYTRRFQKLSCPGLILYVLTMSLACIDWVMSLEPDWYSTILGMLTIVSQGLTAFAFAALVVSWLAPRKNLLGNNLGAQNLHDIGNLLFTFLLLWAYMAFSQFLISWNGNEAYEARWYSHRQVGGWGYVSAALILTHFFLPFVLLLFGGVKRHSGWLGGVAVLVLLARLLDSYWLIEPSFYPQGLHFGWLDLVLPIAIGALCLPLWSYHLRRAPLLPLRDPRLLLETERTAQEAT